MQAAHGHLPCRGPRPGCARCEATGNVFGGPPGVHASPTGALALLLACSKARGWKLPEAAVAAVRRYLCLRVGDRVKVRCMPGTYEVVWVSGSGDTFRAIPQPDGIPFAFLFFAREALPAAHA